MGKSGQCKFIHLDLRTLDITVLKLVENLEFIFLSQEKSERRENTLLLREFVPFDMSWWWTYVSKLEYHKGRGLEERWNGRSCKINEPWYIALFVVSGSIKMLFSIDCVNVYFSQSIAFVNIYLFSIFFAIDSKSVGLPHIAYIVIMRDLLVDARDQSVNKTKSVTGVR